MIKLALRYILYHRSISILLIAGFTLVVSFPLVAWRVLEQVENQYSRRARQTPLLIGRKTNSYALVINSVYFAGDRPPTITKGLLDDLRQKDHGALIPLYNQFTARGYPVIGTDPAYFELRELNLVSGAYPALIGECAIGHTVAQEQNLSAGSDLLTDKSSFLNLTHESSFRLKVSGVLAPSNSVDDRALFVDIKTAWIIEGWGHGHDDVLDSKKGNDDQGLEFDPATTQPEELEQAVDAVLGKGVAEFRSISSKNIASFHYHGDEHTFPLHAIIVIPHSSKDEVMVKGVINTSDDLVALPPGTVVDELLQIVFNVKLVFDGYFVLILISTAAFLLIIILLSLRNRKQEFELLYRLGCSPKTTFTLFLIQFTVLIAASGIIALAVSETALAYVRHIGF